MNKILNFGRFNFLVTSTGRSISVTAINTSTGLFVGGWALCAPGDDFDIRVGVPLALKRALRQLKGVDRPAITRGFFRQWPEAHPEYKRPRPLSSVYSPKPGDMVTRLTVARGGDGETGEVLKVTKVEEVPYTPPVVREFSVCDNCGASHEVRKYPNDASR